MYARRVPIERSNDRRIFLVDLFSCTRRRYSLTFGDAFCERERRRFFARLPSVRATTHGMTDGRFYEIRFHRKNKRCLGGRGRLVSVSSRFSRKKHRMALSRTTLTRRFKFFPNIVGTSDGRFKTTTDVIVSTAIDFVFPPVLVDKFLFYQIISIERTIIDVL